MTGYREPLIVPLAPGTPITGVWCETCLLPSRYAVPIYALGSSGPSRIGTASRCEGCHQ